MAVTYNLFYTWRGGLPIVSIGSAPNDFAYWRGGLPLAVWMPYLQSVAARLPQ